MTAVHLTKSVRELIRELVELQHRIDEVRARQVTAHLCSNELVQLAHREGQVIAALRRHRRR